MTILASDSYNRTVSGSWGTATSGQAWTTLAGGTGMAVNGSEAVNTMTSTDGVVAGVLGMTPSINTDVTLTWSLDELPRIRGNAGVRVMARYIDGTNDYHARVTAVTGTGELSIGIYRADAAVIAGPVRPDIYATAGGKIHSRIQALGSSPTTLRAKMWLDGTPEPDWQVTGTDSTAALQVAARIGLRCAVGGGAGTPLVCRFHGMTVQDGKDRVFVGTKPVKSMFVGTKPVKALYAGNKLIWP